jgi:hypothetical protein
MPGMAGMLEIIVVVAAGEIATTKVKKIKIDIKEDDK